MSQQTRPALREEVSVTVIWLVAMLSFSAWVPFSFAPAAGALSAWGDPLAVLIEVAFFASGAFGLLTAYAVYRWLSSGSETKAPVDGETRIARVRLLTLYAFAWLTAYGLYSLV